MGKVIHWELCKKFKFEHTYKRYIHNPDRLSWRMRHKHLRDFKTKQFTRRPYDNQQKKKTCWIIDFVILGDHRVKLKENKKNDKYQDLARELKRMWNMKVTFIPIVICAVGPVTLVKELEVLEIRGKVKTI